MNITNIYRYPVKGLSCEPLQQVTLMPGECIPQDRRFALARPETDFDPERPEWLPKTKFIMLMRDEKLTKLRTRFDPESGYLNIESNGQAVRSCITESAGRTTVEAFFGELLKDSLTGWPRIVEAAGHTFSDAQRKPNSATYKYVSLINLESIRALEEVAGKQVDPIRFRANVYFDGVPAWTELGWIGSHITIGDARLKVVSPTTRCAATTVNPTTAERDMNIPAILKFTFGHVCMGVYAEVAEPGTVFEGDAVAAPAGL